MELEGYQSKNSRSLLELYAQDPEAANPWLDELAEQLEEELTMVLQSEALFLSHTNDFGEIDYPIHGEQSIRGWRLHFDIPQGRISYSGWSEAGTLVAYVSSSVDAETIVRHAEQYTDYESLTEDDEAYQEAENQARLSLRDIVDPYFLTYDGDPSFSSSPVTPDACRTAIIKAILSELD